MTHSHLVQADNVPALIADALPAICVDDARNCANANDLSGLAYIINIAHGYNGNSYLKLGYVLDVADLYKGHENRVQGRSH